MRTTKLRIAALALVSAFALTPVVAAAESLSDAMVSAYRNSGLLDQQRALLRASDEDVAVAVAATRPVVNYAINANWTYRNPAVTIANTFSLSATLAASMTLYDFGRSDISIKMAEENVMMARDMLKGVEQQVLLRAVSAFLAMRSAHETAMLQANNVRLITQELRAAKDRFEVGETTQTDVSIAEARLAAARSLEASARGQLMIAREEYKVAVGHYPNGLQVPPGVPMTARTLDAAKALARRRHPDVLATQRQVTLSDLAIDMAKKNLLPTLSADASLTGTATNAPSGNFTTASVGVSLAGPIYTGGRLSALLRKAIAESEATRSGLHIAVKDVEQSVGNAWANLAIATASLQATDRQIRASRVALRGAREEATLGARTTLEVLNYEQELLDAEAARIEAQSNQYIAAYNLLASMGLLTAKHLGLGIATYDPEAYFEAVSGAPVHFVSPQGERLDAVINAIAPELAN